jgi:hypothetical protein
MMMGAWAGGWLGVALDTFLFNVYNNILASFFVLWVCVCVCEYILERESELVCHNFLHKKFVIV